MTTFEVIHAVPRPSDGGAAIARAGRPAREALLTDRAPSSPLYAQGIRVGETIYLSGMVGIDAQTGRLAGPTVQEQARQAVANCAEVLAVGGASLADVVEVGILLGDPDDFAALGRRGPPSSASTRPRGTWRRWESRFPASGCRCG